MNMEESRQTLLFREVESRPIKDIVAESLDQSEEDRRGIGCE